MRAGREEEAAQLYYKSVNMIDSTYNESLSKQINQLRTIHEVDKLELQNKQIELESERYKLTISLALVAVLIVVLIVSVFHYLRIKHIKSKLEKSDKELKKDKELLLQSEKKLVLAMEKAEASNQFKDAFLANLSHEIRTPLNSIVGFSSLLGNMQQQSEAKEYASIIKHNSDLLLKLVNDAVSVTLLQTGQVPFTKEEVDICEICRTLVQDYATKAKPGVAVEANLHKETFILNTDKKHIKQVLENLLSNAVKFTEKGCIILSTELAEDGNYIRFVVTDTGIGIPETIQNKMFDTFQKQDSFIQGVGLGLTICKLIAQSLNGSICLDTEYKKGTRMIFNHPII